MNQSTQNLRSKSSSFWLHLLLGFIGVFAYPFISSASANTPISIDPYNDSNFQPLSIETSPIKTNSSSNNKTPLPAGNQNSSIGEILIKGNPTPPPPIIESGNLIKSNQTLPQIPPLSEPFRNPNINDEINPNSPDNENTSGKISTLSVSTSPFDQTPDDNQPNLSNPKTATPSSNPAITPRTINLSPSGLSSRNNNSSNTENSETSSPQPVLGKRRSLSEILVFSTPPENKANTSTITPTTSVNSAISSTTKTNNIHKVLVKINNSAQESQVKSLYPEAFNTNLKGEKMLQVGVFSNADTAQQISNSLKKIGLNVSITQN